MHDEAVSHYRDDLLQLQLGRAWLWSEFRVEPRSGWLIDPFGHSPTTPLFYQGMKGVVLNRIHYQIREERKSSKELEFIWQPKWFDPPAKK
jgi:alpha-mannosidase II